MTNNSSQKRYPDELKERAVKMVLELQREDPNDHGVFSRVARELGVGSESLRTWVKRSEIKLGVRAGMTDAERDELTKLRREVKELRRANAMADSTGRRNELSESLRWCHIAEGLAWTPIETALNCAQLRWSDGRKVHALGQVLAQ